MSILVDCPYCKTRVLPLADRRCPACLKSVDATAEQIERDRAEEAAYRAAAEQVHLGANPVRVQAQLARQGLDARQAATFVNDLEQTKLRARRDIAQKKMVVGALWFFSGIMATFVSYQSAWFLGGGVFIISWGTIIFGAVQFFRGLSELPQQQQY